MRCLTFLIALLVCAMSAEVRAVPVGVAKDLDELLDTAPLIVIAESVPRPGVDHPPPPDAPWEVEVNVLAVLKGDAEPGRMLYKSSDKLEPGERYILFGAWARRPDQFLLSPKTDLNRLEGKPLREQVTRILAERREYLERSISDLTFERERVDALHRPGRPGIADPQARTLGEALDLASVEALSVTHTTPTRRDLDAVARVIELLRKMPAKGDVSKHFVPGSVDSWRLELIRSRARPIELLFFGSRLQSPVDGTFYAREGLETEAELFELVDGLGSPHASGEEARGIDRAEALRLAEAAIFERVQIPAGTEPKVEESDTAFVVTYPTKLAPGVRGADYHAQVTINRRDGKVTRFLVGS